MEYIKLGDSVKAYDRDGNPVPNATKSQIIKNDLVGSVTQIVKEQNNNSLNQWKLNNLYDTTIKVLSEGSGEFGSDELKRKIFDKSKELGSKAAEFGTNLHGWLADYLTLTPDQKEHKKSQGNFAEKITADWLDANVDHYRSEYVVVGEDYGGTVDLLAVMKDGSRWICDFKSNNMEPRKVYKDVKGRSLYKDEDISSEYGEIRHAQNVTYPSWCMQLSAYERCHDDIDGCMNIVVSSNEEFPGIWLRTWSREELDNAWNMFKACKTLFYGGTK